MRISLIKIRRPKASRIAWIALVSFIMAMAVALFGVGYQHSLAANAAQEKIRPIYTNIEALPGQSEKLVDRRIYPLVPFVIYGSPALDVTRIDPASLSVSGAQVMKRPNGKLKTSLRDVNQDGHMDLVFFVWAKDMKLAFGETKGTLNARTIEGTPVYAVTSFRFEDSTPPAVDEKAAAYAEAKKGLATSGVANLFTESSAPPSITPETATYSNTSNITINSVSPAPTAATPFPSVINVNNFRSGLVVGSLTVTLNGVNHGFPDDIDMLLCSPDNTCMIIWSDVGGSNCLGTASNKPTCSNPAATVTLDDGATASLPDATLITSGTYKPTNIGTGDSFVPASPTPVPSPPPAGPYADPSAGATLRGTFQGKNANGDWSLYVVDDLSTDTGNITGGWTLSITPAAQFTNSAARIVINDSATPPTPATPYPSTINVSGLPTTGLSKVTVQLNGLSHNFPDDIDILLVGPTGANAVIMSDVGGNICIGQDSNNPSCPNPAANLTLDDNAPTALPDLPSTPLASGTYQPTNVGTGDTFPSPAPAPSGGSALSVFKGTNPNGTWSLYVVDDQNGDSGAITNGWGLNLFTPTAADATIAGEVLTPDGRPLEGVEVRLSGARSLRTITDANGSYQFTGIETGGFYTVTPSKANYSFSPGERAFSQTGNKTEATFTAQPAAQQTANAIDSALFFVRQHYVDFLGREPDADGLAYWTSQIERCGDDAGCVRERRNAVSAAFFKSTEFQETGSFIYRLYRGALGRQVSYAEFTSDRQQVVGGAALEANKAAFADAFVQRPEFVQRYQGISSADAFVDTLIQTVRQSSGVDLNGERSALIAKYNTGGSLNESRSLVMRDAIESAAFKDAVYNHSFVLMQYFGYLKRNPDQGGLDFWYNVLNNKEPNNYLGMVCSFVTSAEYQMRFASVVTHSNAECSR